MLGVAPQMPCKEPMPHFFCTVAVYGVENIAPADDIDLALSYCVDQLWRGAGQRI